MMIHMSETDLAQIVKQETIACAAIVETELAKAEKYGMAHTGEVLQRVAALIRARAIK